MKEEMKGWCRMKEEMILEVSDERGFPKYTIEPCNW